MLLWKKILYEVEIRLKDEFNDVSDYMLHKTCAILKVSSGNFAINNNPSSLIKLLMGNLSEYCELNAALL